MGFVFGILEYTQRLQKQDHKEYRGYELDHSNIQRFAPERIVILRNFINNGLRFYNPAYQDTGQDRYDRHHDIIAEIIHNIQNLRHGAVRQFVFKVEDIVAEAYDDADNKCVGRCKGGALLP